MFHIALWHTTCHLSGASFISCPVFCICLPCRLILCRNCKLYCHFPKNLLTPSFKDLFCVSIPILGVVWFQCLQVICFLITWSLTKANNYWSLQLYMISSLSPACDDSSSRNEKPTKTQYIFPSRSSWQFSVPHYIKFWLVVRAQTLNLSLGALVLPDVNF